MFYVIGFVRQIVGRRIENVLGYKKIKTNQRIDIGKQRIRINLLAAFFKIVDNQFFLFSTEIMLMFYNGWQYSCDDFVRI